MKKIGITLISIFVIALSGCVQTVFTKTVQVTKDENGKVIQTVETEGVSQPGSTWPVKFEHMKK